MFEDLIFYGRHFGKDCQDYIFNACYYPVYRMFTDKGKFNNENFMNSIVIVKFTRYIFLTITTYTVLPLYISCYMCLVSSLN